MPLLYKEEFFRTLQWNLCYSENTISAYKRDIYLYEEFLKKQKDMRKFYEFLTSKKLSARSQARVISCVRGYLKFLQGKGKNVDGLEYLKLPRTHSKLPKFTTFDEFEQLLKACVHTSEVITIRNRLVLFFLYGLGCRVSELVNLNLTDFNQPESWIQVVGKGKKQRLLPLSRELYKNLMYYLQESRGSLASSTEPALFVNNKGRRPSRVDIWRWLKNWSLKAGFEEVKNPHSFRHGCATVLLEQGVDLRSIQKLLGHLHLQTTQIYTKVTSKHLKKTVDRCHPLSAIKKKVA